MSLPALPLWVLLCIGLALYFCVVARDAEKMSTSTYDKFGEYGPTQLETWAGKPVIVG